MAGDKNAREISRQLRTGRSDSLRRRRAIVSLSMVSIGCMATIALYQVGILRRLPDPPLPGFNAERVDAAPEAYARLDTPDAFLGLVSYSVTAMLAAMGGKQRAERSPWIPLTMAGKTLIDAAQAAKLTRDQWVKHRAFCGWCLVAASATFAAVPFALIDAAKPSRAIGRRSAPSKLIPSRLQSILR